MNAKLTILAAAGFFAIVLPLSTVQSTEAVEDRTEQLEEAQETVKEAAKVAQKMKSDPELVQQMKAAKGIFIIPNYGRAALGIGGAGGEGVLLMHRNGQWSSPMFYNLAAISAGVEAGIEAGQIAMLLMNKKALQDFMANDHFSLNADAGFTIIDYSARAQGAYGKGDIIIWSDTEGVFADLAVNVEGIVWDDEKNAAYYDAKTASPLAIAKGDIKTYRGEFIQKVLP